MNTLSLGLTGIAVKTLQKLLIKKGYDIVPDGVYGKQTEACVLNFQQENGLIADGLVGAATWSSLGKSKFLRLDTSLRNVTVPSLQPISLTSNSLNTLQKQVAYSYNNYGNLVVHLSNKLMIEPAAAHAIIATESAGDGFLGGRLKIRFENHIFFRYWGKYNKDVFNSHFRFSSDKQWKQHFVNYTGQDQDTWDLVHASQDSEWFTFELARTLDEFAAIKSISMGAPQIMGFHYEKLGFRTPATMFAEFASNIRIHILAMFDFVCLEPQMITALQEKDWNGFAYFYNGPGQAEKYGEYIKNRYEAAKQLNI
jgi:hypothetical protein